MPAKRASRSKTFFFGICISIPYENLKVFRATSYSNCFAVNAFQYDWKKKLLSAYVLLEWLSRFLDKVVAPGFPGLLMDPTKRIVRPL